MKIIINSKSYPVILANNYFKKLVGLMFNKNINYGLLLPKCNAVHTFFMKTSIDIIALNENNQVIEIRNNINKNKIIKINYPITKCSILELPTDHSLDISIGMIVKIKGSY